MGLSNLTCRSRLLNQDCPVCCHRFSPATWHLLPARLLAASPFAWETVYPSLPHAPLVLTVKPEMRPFVPMVYAEFGHTRYPSAPASLLGIYLKGAIISVEVASPNAAADEETKATVLSLHPVGRA